MKMDDRDSAEYQNWEMKGHKGQFWKVEVTRRQNSAHDLSSPLKLKRKTWETKKGDPVAEISSLE